MKPAHVALIALAVAILAGGGGYFFGADSAPNHAARALDLALDDPFSDEPAPPVKPAGTDRPARSDTAFEQASTQASPPPRVDSEAGAFKAWLASIGGELPVAGTGRIHGRVLTADARPIPGATVTATPQYPTPADYSEDRGLEEVVARYARTSRFSRTGKAEAVTDADGRYEISNLGDYEYSISAKAQGFRLNQTARNQWRVRPDAEVNFEGSPVCELRLDVRLPNGEQPARANIVFKSGTNSRTQHWSPGSPKVTVDPGSYQATATAGDHSEFMSDEFELQLAPGEEEPERRVDLIAKPGILCVAEVPDGYGSRFRVSIRIEANPSTDPPAESAGTAGREMIYEMEMYRYSGSAGANQQAFAGLEPGRYRLIASGGGKVLAWDDVTLGNEFKTVTLQLPEPDVGSYLVVRVFSPDGSPMSNANVRVSTGVDRNQYAGWGGQATQVVIAKPDGVYWVAKAESTDESLYYSIAVRSNEHGNHTARHNAKDGDSVDVRFPTPATLTIHLAGAEGNPKKDRIRPSLMQQTESNSWTGVSNSSRNSDIGAGVLKYGPISPGTYRFSLSVSGSGESHYWGMHSGQSGALAEWTFEVATGENTQHFTIPSFHTLTLVIADTSGIQQLRLQRSDGQSSRHIYGNGILSRTVIEGITPGEWVISTNDGEMRTRVNGDTEVQLQVLPFDCLRLSNVKQGGRIEQLGLRTGDLILAVDGQDFENLTILRSQIQGSYARESTTWTISRNGARMNISFNGKRIAEAQTLSGAEREYLGMSGARSN